MSLTATVGGLAVEYDASVLKPRSWTEAQARWAAELSPGLPDGPLLELCSGVGHIGLLAASLTGRDTVLVDASPTAVAFARRNARQVMVAGLRVEVRHGPMTDVLRKDERFPLVLADPPYLRSADITQYPDDPPSAVDGGEDGLATARSCCSCATRTRPWPWTRPPATTGCRWSRPGWSATTARSCWSVVRSPSAPQPQPSSALGAAAPAGVRLVVAVRGHQRETAVDGDRRTGDVRRAR